MKLLKVNIPIILLVLFEMAVGILLLRDPDGFTRTVIILFGAVLLVIGLTYLIRFLKAKKEGVNRPLALIVAILAFLVGAFCAFLSGVILKLITAVAILYGIMLAISGIYKIYNFIQVKKLKLPVSAVNILSGILAVALGVLIILYPHGAVITVWKLAGILLFVEAVVDILTIVLAVRINKKLKEQ